MYEISFEADGKKIVKKAKTKGDVRRLVYIYTTGTQQEIEAKIKELTLEKIEKPISKQKKIIEDVDM